MSDILNTILARKLEEIAECSARVPLAELKARIAEASPVRGFADALIAERGVRPTALQPVWNVAGFALGAATAAIGPAAAMACTVAVETEIDLHYQEQLEALGNDDPALSAAVAEFRAEELEHRDSALAAGAETAPAYPLLAGVIRLACKAAIAVSKRI